MNAEEAIKSFWENEIKEKKLYRAHYTTDYNYLIREGIRTGDDPYKNIRSDLNKLWSLVKKLEKKGLKIEFDFDKDKKASDVIKWSKRDNEGLDFSSQRREVENYYARLQGGALVSNSLTMIHAILSNWKSPLVDKNTTRYDQSMLTRLQPKLESLQKKTRLVIIGISMGSYILDMEYHFSKRIGLLRRKHPADYLGSYDKFKKYCLKQKILETTFNNIKSDLSRRFYYRVRGHILGSMISVLEDKKSTV